MEISQRRLNRVDILTITGRVDAATAPRLKEALDAVCSAERYNIVLDLAGLEYISSPGLRVLIETRKRVRDWKITNIEGGDIRIANMPPRIKEVFDLTGFTALFEIFDDTVAAVGSF